MDSTTPVEHFTVEGPRSEQPTRNDSTGSTTSKPLIRILTTTTLSSSTCRSDMDSLSDESVQGEFLEQDSSIAMHKEAPNPLEKALRSVTKKVLKWRKKMAQRRKAQEAHLLQQVQKEAEFAHSPEGIRLRRKRLESLGEMGLALFAPIEGAFSESRDELDVGELSEPKTTMVARSEAPADDDIDHADDFIRIQVAPDDNTIPRLLSEGIMKELVKAMPYTLRGRSWTRLFSITRDGDSFGSFLNGVERNESTVVVVQTTKGEIIGGFADATWECRGVDGNFFGAGTSFIFSLVRSQENSDPIQIFRWQGVNDYSQVCRQGCIGMGGGGGSFGLFLQDDFTKGSSGACDTFGNAGPLTSSPCFDILNFEVYGFSERVW
ncbi:hypothetical protein MHU86_4185 [Fragilaria crotonensis]|nr:hypothetical protein MHU86_4185 [Fragilaria crotonensis]